MLNDNIVIIWPRIVFEYLHDGLGAPMINLNLTLFGAEASVQRELGNHHECWCPSFLRRHVIKAMASTL